VTVDRGTPTAPGSRPTLLYFPSDGAVEVSPATRLAGLPIAERVLRAAWRAGYGSAIVRADPEAPGFARLQAAIGAAGGEVTMATTANAWEDALRKVRSSGVLTAIGAGTVVSPPLLEAAANISPAAHGVADVPAGVNAPESGVIRVSRARAIDANWIRAELAARRARALPLPSGQEVADGRARLAIRIVVPEDRRAAEATIRRASYKDTDSKIARFNRRMSMPISIALLQTPLTANQLSVILVAIGLYSAWLFSLGRYWTGVLAAGLSLAASILDGCDGEIARLKYQESALGCWIETIGDYAYYIAIFIGLTVGVVRQTHVESFYWIGALALAGTLLSFAMLIFLRNRITAGQPEKLHAIARDRFQADRSWLARATWRVSFVATRAAMPYGIFAFALLGILPGIVALAALGANIYWISLAVKLRALLGGQEAATA
jgi:phosphatidylglycerophosphate synthase